MDLELLVPKKASPSAASRTHKPLLTMRSFGAISAILAFCLSSAEANSGLKWVTWPENGSIKFSTPAAPQRLAVDVVDCMKVDVNFPENLVKVELPSGESLELTSGERLQPNGGQLVVLFSSFGGQGHVIVNGEDVAGGFDTRMSSFAVPECFISRVRVTSPDGGELPSESLVAISEEIVNNFKKSYGAQSVNVEQSA